MAGSYHPSSPRFLLPRQHIGHLTSCFVYTSTETIQSYNQYIPPRTDYPRTTNPQWTRSRRSSTSAATAASRSPRMTFQVPITSALLRVRRLSCMKRGAPRRSAAFYSITIRGSLARLQPPTQLSNLTANTSHQKTVTRSTLSSLRCLLKSESPT